MNKEKDLKAHGAKKVPLQRVISCERAEKLTEGCIVIMSSSSGCVGYGNPQCVKDVCEQLGEISLYGHNQHYKSHDVLKILEYPLVEVGN